LIPLSSSPLELINALVNNCTGGAKVWEKARTEKTWDEDPAIGRAVSHLTSVLERLTGLEYPVQGITVDVQAPMILVMESNLF
jgi:hypothetical protein